MPHHRIAGARAGRVAGLLGLALLGSGCALPKGPLEATVPPEWRRGNPYGPQANALRAQGLLQPLYCPSQLACWEAFARVHIQDGDLLFRRGKAITPLSKLASRAIAKISGGPFSHDGLCHWDGDTLFVYDAEQEGIRKVPFAFWMLDTRDGTLAVKRLKEPYRHAIAAAIAYCDDAYQRQVPFDTGLRPDDERLYCSEMIEKAFASGGVRLSCPVPIRCLPNFAHYRWLAPLVERFSEFRTEVAVWAPGNDCYGTYSSPYLELVYKGSAVNRRRHKPPTCVACGNPHS
jgi:hypothetical protein